MFDITHVDAPDGEFVGDVGNDEAHQPEKTYALGEEIERGPAVQREFVRALKRINRDGDHHIHPVCSFGTGHVPVSFDEDMSVGEMKEIISAVEEKANVEVHNIYDTGFGLDFDFLD